ncbi:MAG TPA: hypothetical protein VGM64_05420 [Lacunisphaera sp.]|jgi:hypothetical protein
MKTSSPLKTFWKNRRFTIVLAMLTTVTWWAAASWPWLLGKIGISDYGTPYLDSYAILAALDAYRAGADVHAANALDPLFRGHVYSDWWLGLRWLGLTRADNFMVGTTWVAAFGVTVWATVRPKRLFEAIWMLLILDSPVVLLALKRANNDLLIFVLLAGCALVASSPAWWRWLVAIVCLSLATGLKYFPAPVALAYLWIRPIRRTPAAFLAALLAVCGAMAGIWTQVDRARFVVGSGVYTMGAPLLLRDLGWQDNVSAIPGLVLILAAGLTLALTRTTTGLLKEGEPSERMRAAIGSIVLLTCFTVGVNYSYRWIFIVWPAAWLVRRSADRLLPFGQRWVARWACALIAACLWSDGIFCFYVNVRPAVTERNLGQMQYVLRLWIQPLNWLLMFLIAGWLIEAGLSTVCEWWSARAELRPTVTPRSADGNRRC